MLKYSLMRLNKWIHMCSHNPKQCKEYFQQVGKVTLFLYYPIYITVFYMLF